MNQRRLPSYIIPLSEIKLKKLSIVAAPPVEVSDDWGRKHWSASVIVTEDGYNGLIDKWIYLHALLANSILPIWCFQAFGHTEYDFNVNEITNPKAEARQIPFSVENALPAIYFQHEVSGDLSYAQIYETYLAQDEKYKAALQNYLLAIDLDINKRLRGVSTEFWQVVMYISAMESLIRETEYCKGRCSECGKGLNRPVTETASLWNELLFDRIADKKVRKQYRTVFEVARSKIRNNAVHNGLIPQLIFGKSSLSDGVNIISAEDAVSGYMEERDHLETLVDLVKQMCRYVLLNQVIGKNIFPPLKGFEIHKITFGPITTSTASLDISPLLNDGQPTS